MKVLLKIKNINYIKIFNNFNPLVSSILKNIRVSPNIILTWMNRASRVLPNEKFGRLLLEGLVVIINLKIISNAII